MNPPANAPKFLRIILKGEGNKEIIIGYQDGREAESVVNTYHKGLLQPTDRIGQADVANPWSVVVESIASIQVCQPMEQPAGKVWMGPKSGLA